jgi:hypothetical protein
MYQAGELVLRTPKRMVRRLFVLSPYHVMDEKDILGSNGGSSCIHAPVYSSILAVEWVDRFSTSTEGRGRNLPPSAVGITKLLLPTPEYTRNNCFPVVDYSKTFDVKGPLQVR